ncbi:uncharacterized protein LOC134744372 [Cydia strobilella]|uniref:uncharacterized protein LOC134744372 n=1 Tax=Cydia strobilella TaxID=1100964 RepID=UPI00300621DD
MESSDYKIKFKALFDKLFHNKFELSAKHSEDLLKYLDGRQDKCVAKILETPFFANLLVFAIKNREFASTSVKIFYSKLVTIVLSNEVLFNRFVQMQGFELLVDRSYAESAAADTPTELRLATAQQAMALVAHYSGVKYVVENTIYQRVLTSLAQHRPPAEAAAVLYEFIAKLIWRLNEYEEEEALLEVLKYIVKPLLEYSLSSSTTEAEDQMIRSESLLASLHALVHILGEVEHLAEPNNVVSMLSQVFSIESNLTTALEKSREPELARLLAEATVRYHYAASRQVASLRPDSETRVNQEFHEAINKIMCTLIKKRSFAAVLEFLCQCHAFWHKVERVAAQVAFEKFGKKFILQNHFLLLMLMPIYLRQKYGKRLVRDLKMEDATEIFHSDVARTIPYDMVNTGYDLRDLITESTGNNLTLACTYSLRELLRLKWLLSRQQACVVFQMMFYTLSEFVLSDGSDLVLLANPLRTPDDVRFLALILDAIAMLLDEHEINWHESLEIGELQAALINLIKQNILPVELLVQVLELVTTCVCKLLSPELALLIEPQRGGSLSEAAGAARRVLQRPESEARLAALQLILSFLEVAYVKFMPLRAMISAHGLLCGAAHCAIYDPDTRTQAAALRCLVAAASCEDLWTEMLDHCQNLYEQLVSILRHNPDGEVRKKAANVLTHVYINRKVNQAFIARVSKTMARAATEDPHWPVQIAALNFWKQLMKRQFTDRGMIDGTFPSVTFCKDKRKIIVLNEKEIHKQLEIGMDNLSKTGCLAVMVKCLNSSNCEVMEKAYEITRGLVEALDHYKFSGVSSVVKNAISPTPPTDTDEVQAKKARSLNTEEGEVSDTDIISEIFECLSTGSSKSDTSPIEIIEPCDFIDKVREAATRRPSKVDLGTLIDELVAL